MKYKDYMYLFPPRPEQTTHHTELSKYDNGEYIAQPKYNGSCCVVFLNETNCIVMNRHKTRITSDYSNIDFRGMYSGKGWMVLCGEFMNKSKKGEQGETWNLKFVAFDILVYNGEYMIGTTFKQRVDLLEKLFPCHRMMIGEKFESMKYTCITNCKNVYRATSYYANFENLYSKLITTDMYEGIVLKRADAKLTLGMAEKNNNSWQIKCRKPTKNYAF